MCFLENLDENYEKSSEQYLKNCQKKSNSSYSTKRITKKEIIKHEEEKQAKDKKKTVLSNKRILKILNFRIVSVEGHFVNMH